MEHWVTWVKCISVIRHLDIFQDNNNCFKILEHVSIDTTNHCQPSYNLKTKIYVTYKLFIKIKKTIYNLTNDTR